jgi:hypothetical protein
VRAVHVRLDLEDEGREAVVVGAMGPLSVMRGSGSGIIVTKASRNCGRPKFVSALPKNIGVTSPCASRSGSSASPAASSRSSSSRSAA